MQTLTGIGNRTRNKTALQCNNHGHQKLILAEKLAYKIIHNSYESRSCYANPALFHTMMEIINIMPTALTAMPQSSSG